MIKQYIIEEIYSAITQFAEKLDQIQESDIVQASADGNTDGEGTLMYEIGELIGACNNTSDFIEEHYGITPDFPYTLTSEGREKVKWYIDGMKEKRKEILDAELDTADDTPVPDENDILSDIASSEEFDEDAGYVGQTGVSGAGSLIQNDTYGTGHGAESDKSGSKKGAMGVDIQVPDGVEDPDRNRVYRDFVGEAGRRGVEKFLKHKEEVLADGSRLKFKDYASLRVNGRDGLSRLNAEDIAGGLEYGEAARNTVCWYLAGRYADYAMRWYARGLPLEDAIRKVLVDREINDNYLKYGHRNP